MAKGLLQKAKDFKVGDVVCFENASYNYRIEAIEEDAIGNIRHRFGGDTASNSYHPNEYLYRKPWSHIALS